MHLESFQCDHLIGGVVADGNSVEIFVRINTLNYPRYAGAFQTNYIGWNEFKLKACYRVLFVISSDLIEPIRGIYPELDGSGEKIGVIIPGEYGLACHVGACGGDDWEEINQFVLEVSSLAQDCVLGLSSPLGLLSVCLLFPSISFWHN